MDKFVALLKQIKKTSKKWSSEITQTESKDKTSKRVGSATLKKMLLDWGDKNDLILPQQTDSTLLKGLFEFYLPDMSQKKLRQVLGLLDPILQAMLEKFDSIHNVYTDYRKLVKDIHGHGSKHDEIAHDYKVFGVTFQQIEKARGQRQDRIDLGNFSLTTYKAIDIYKAIEQTIKSSHWEDVMIALQLSCGFRFTEGLEASKFLEIKDKPDFIKQIGVLKDPQVKRGEEDKSKVEIIKPLVGLTAKQFKAGLKRVRTGYTKSNRNNSSTLRVVNDKIKKYFPNTTSHDLRKIYASVSYEMFGKKEHLSLVGWISRTLGHENLSTASLSYSTVQIEFSHQNETSTEILSKLDMLLAKNELLEARVAELEGKGMSVGDAVTAPPVVETHGIPAKILNAVDALFAEGKSISQRNVKDTAKVGSGRLQKHWSAVQAYVETLERVESVGLPTDRR